MQVAAGEGRLYISGNFKGTLTFGGTSLTSKKSGKYDIFVAEMSPSDGSFKWAVRAGTTTSHNAYARALQYIPIHARVVLVGYFTGTMQSGSRSVTSYSTDPNAYNCYILNLNNAGETQRLYRWGSSAGNAVCQPEASTYGAGMMYVAGGVAGSSPTFHAKVGSATGAPSITEVTRQLIA